MAVDLKTLSPDGSFPGTGFLFGADSQSASAPSVYAIGTVLDYMRGVDHTWTGTNNFAFVERDADVSGVYDQMLGYTGGSAEGVPFSFCVNHAEFVGGGVGGEDYTNSVWEFGINVGDIVAVPAVSGKARLATTMEFKYNNGGIYGSEYHLQMSTTGGTNKRWFSAFLPHSSSTGSSLSFALDQVAFSTWGGTQKFLFRLADNTVDVKGGTHLSFETNDTAVLKQFNAAGNAALNLPYIDASNRLRASQPVYVQGTWPASNTFLHLQATGSGSSGSALINMEGSVSSGVLYGSNLVGSAPQELTNLTYNSHSTGHAVNKLLVLAANSGDPKTIYDINSGTGWAVGVDNSDGDKFKISTYDFDPSYDQFIIDPAVQFRVSLKGPLRLPSKAVADLTGGWAASTIGAGSIIYVSNGDAGSPCLAMSNGTDWLRVVAGAAVSAT